MAIDIVELVWRVVTIYNSPNGMEIKLIYTSSDPKHHTRSIFRRDDSFDLHQASKMLIVMRLALLSWAIALWWISNAGIFSSVSVDYFWSVFLWSSCLSFLLQLNVLASRRRSFLSWLVHYKDMIGLIYFNHPTLFSLWVLNVLYLI